MYTLLFGAKKNVGDFLILDRARKLLEKHKPNHEHLLVKRWLPIDKHSHEINQSDAVLLCGGPAYQEDFYPGIYPLVKNIMDIKVPIIPFGLGWFSEFPEQEPDEFRFSNSSYLMIDHIHRNCPITSTRDYFTEGILKNHGFHNTIMTGCPAWYELDHIEKSFSKVTEINRLVVTTAQNKRFHPQNIELLEKVTKMFPNAEKFCVFHRGILSDHETPKSEEQNLLKIMGTAEEFGFKVIDASYDVEKIKFYEECDLHIGYRVHAHIYFLSIRKPSFLLHEDGRGRGFTEAMDLKYDVPAFLDNSLDSFLNGIKEESEDDFRSFVGLEKKFQAYYRNMQSFISSLP